MPSPVKPSMHCGIPRWNREGGGRHTCTHVCSYTHTHTHTHTIIHKDIHTLNHTDKHTHRRRHNHTHTHTYTQSFKHTCVQSYTETCTQSYTQPNTQFITNTNTISQIKTHTHTHTRAHTHDCFPINVFLGKGLNLPSDGRDDVTGGDLMMSPDVSPALDTIRTQTCDSVPEHKHTLYHNYTSARSTTSTQPTR